MHCANCGSPINQELNYCNRCGKRVAANELMKQPDARISILKTLSIATGFVGVIGLGGLFALIAVLVGNNVHSDLIAVLSILFAVTAFGICFLLTRQISRLTETSLSPKQNFKEKFAPEQIHSTAVGQIESHQIPFRSVTENTTRTLDKTNV